jgi:putative flavoprotein involved in K+ transport
VPTRQVQVVVVGAGAAGLATAAELRRRGVDPLVLDRGTAVGDVWRGRYDRLRLHTPRLQSGLPSLAVPASAGRWVARDDYADYLQRYAERAHVVPEFGHEVRSVRRAGHWIVESDRATVHADHVVLAAGFANAPVVPSWAGAEQHSGRYRNAAPYRGQDVLVVGAGNSAAEIAVDLLDGGARVSLSVRTVPPVVPRSIAGVPASLLAIPQQPLPAALADRLNSLARRLTVGDLTPFGLPTPAQGPVTRTRTTGDPPLFDVGLVAALRSGRISVVPAVDRVEGREVVLADGSRRTPDAVVAATGWRPALETLLEGLDVLDGTGRPRVHGAGRLPHAPGLWFVGYRIPARGALFEIALDSRRAARTIADAVLQAW